MTPVHDGLADGSTAAKALWMTDGRLDVFRVETITAVVPDCELSKKRAVGVYSVKMVVQPRKLFNVLTT